MDYQQVDQASFLEATAAANRMRSLIARCPVPIAMIETKDNRQLRLILKHDSLAKRFVPVVEVSLGSDAMGDERWDETIKSNDLLDLLSLTSVYSLHAHVVPGPAQRLIESGNTLVEFMATLAEASEGKDASPIGPKTWKQIGLFLERYRMAYQQLKAYQEQQVIQ